jgi:3-oxoacyl-[acyl-carrier protein] reductase
MSALAGQAAFVTGAAQGLGLAIARGLAAAGARVALADVDAGVAAAAAALRRDGHVALEFVLDVRNEAVFGAGFEHAVAEFGGVDVMVNNAALTSSASLWELTAADWDEVLAVNLRGCFFGCRIAGRHMRGRGRGRIVNLSSIAAQQPSVASGIDYAASKAGILALTRAFALELAPCGVTVNALAPSAFDGPALDRLDAPRREQLARSIPLGRFGNPDDVAAAVVYLASDAASFITGATLDLNGGRLMR